MVSEHLLVVSMFLILTHLVLWYLVSKMKQNNLKVDHTRLFLALER